MRKLKASELVALNRLATRMRSDLRTPLPPVVFPITIQPNPVGSALLSVLQNFDLSSPYIFIESDDISVKIINMLTFYFPCCTFVPVFISFEYDRSQVYYIISDLSLYEADKFQFLVREFQFNPEVVYSTLLFNRENDYQFDCDKVHMIRQRKEVSENEKKSKKS